MGSRYGFTLYSGHPIRNHLLPEVMVVPPEQEVSEVLERALTRQGEAFFHDIAVVDSAHAFLGVISVPILVCFQSHYLSQQMQRLAAHRGQLEETNSRLFRSIHERRQSEGRYEALFDNNPLGVALMDHDGRIEAMNSRLSEWLGWQPESPLPDLWAFLPPGDQAGFRVLLQEHERGALQAAPEHDFDVHFPKAGLLPIRFFIRRVPQTGQLCSTLMDLTHQRALERQMALKDKYALFESLAGGIAHELNNKLSPVFGYAGLIESKLQATGQREDLQHYCRLIVQSAEESVQLIRQLLNFSRPPAAQIGQVNLCTLIQEAAAIFKFRLKNQEVLLSLELPADPLIVMADQAQLKQVLVNLMINGADAMENAFEKLLTISLSRNDVHCILEVSDSGHGIPNEIVNRVFDPFFTTKAADRGTGLGLSVCLGIIKQHRGEIQVESRKGHGSTFRVLLPITQLTVIEAPQFQDSLQPPRGDRRREILVVDDESYITSLVQECLRGQLGWRVDRVHAAREALYRLESSEYDLVITDLRMPDLDGFSILQWMRDFRPSLLSHTLVLTGDAGGKDLESTLEAFGTPVLRKPFSPESLVRSCWSLLQALRPSA
jgi:two-component system NtrC family sensor kinase